MNGRVQCDCACGGAVAALLCIPPHRRDPAFRAIVQRQRLRPRETALERHPVRSAVPLRNHIVAMHQHAVERVRRVDQLLARLRMHERAQDRVDGRRLHPDHVVRAVRVRGLAAEPVDLLRTGHLHIRHADRGRVEVECVESLLIDREVGYAKRRGDAELLQIANEGRDDRLKLRGRAGIVENLELEWLAFGVTQCAVAIGPPRLLQQRARLQQIGAQRAWRIGVRLLRRQTEYGRIELGAPRFEQRQFARRWHALRLQIRIGEEAVDARVLIEEQLPVQPLKVEREIERLAHAHVLEQWPPHVEHEALHAGAVMLRKFALDQLAAIELLADVAPHPIARDIFDQCVVLARLERLEPRGAIRIQLVDDPIEVVHADPHRQRRAPIIRIAPVGNRATVLVLIDQIRPAGDRLLERQLVERDPAAVRLHPPLVREHRHAAHEQRQLAIALMKLEADRMRIDHHRARDLAKNRRELRRGLRAFQRVERKLDVVRGDRIAVRKARARIDVEGGRQAVRRDIDVVGEQAVGGRHFVAAADGQAFEHQIDARCGVTAQRERIEFIEAGEPARIGQHQRAALWRIRIDVVEVLEIRGIFRLAVLRDRIDRLGLGRREQTGEERHAAQRDSARRAPGARHNR